MDEVVPAPPHLLVGEVSHKTACTGSHSWLDLFDPRAGGKFFHPRAVQGIHVLIPKNCTKQGSLMVNTIMVDLDF